MALQTTAHLSKRNGENKKGRPDATCRWDDLKQARQFIVPVRLDPYSRAAAHALAQSVQDLAHFTQHAFFDFSHNAAQSLHIFSHSLQSSAASGDLASYAAAHAAHRCRHAMQVCMQAEGSFASAQHFAQSSQISEHFLHMAMHDANFFSSADAVFEEANRAKQATANTESTLIVFMDKTPLLETYWFCTIK
jgi:hypothetical protein